MKITIAGSLGNISKPLAEQLVQAEHDVTVISSNGERKEAIEALGAKAAIGSISDADFLKKAFEGADAVYTMVPPIITERNILKNAVEAGKAYAAAIKDTGVKRVVMLSSMGADHASGNGPIAALHDIEQVFSQLDGVGVTFLRPGFFFVNFIQDIPMIKGMGIMGSNYPGDTELPLVHPKDIAAAAAEELQKPSTGTHVRYVAGDVRTFNDVASVLGASIGKPNLKWVEFTDEQANEGMVKGGLPEEMAALYTEMGAGVREGKLNEDFIKSGSPVEGRTRLEDFAKEFAAAY